MNTKVVSIVVASLFSCAASSTVLQGPIVNPANGHSYYLLGISTWNQAESEARSLGGHLATIDDKQENEWLYQTFTPFTPGQSANGLWIGINDAAVEGSWVWASSEPVRYTNWSVGEPNGGSSENYANIVATWMGAWNDVPDDGYGAIYGVVEIEPVFYGFSAFVPRAKWEIGGHANGDSYWVSGWIKLAPESNGINPPTEAVTIKVGSFSQAVPAGSFVQDGTSYLYKGTVGSSALDIKIWPLGKPGTYWFKSCLKNASLGATTMKPQVQLTIGDDQGNATLDVGYSKFGTDADWRKWLSSNNKNR